MSDTQKLDEMTTIRSNRWTQAEDDAFRKMAEANIRSELIAAKLNRSVRAIKARAYAIGLPLKSVKLDPIASEEAPPRSFKCPKLDCGAEYFAIEQDVPPPAKPKCMECGTPFLASTREKFVHYCPTRHIFD
jgi:hypothetical protein